MTLERAVPLEEGRTLAEGRYRLESPIGQGAMGAVWKAWDERLQRQVAVKLVLGAWEGDGAERLRDEARAAAALRHPSLVAVLDAGEEAGLGPWVVSELLPGRTLRDRLKGKAMTRDEVLHELAPALLGALQAIHDAGMVHRDVKPENVFVDGDGAYRLGDFGLAVFQGREARTRTGLFMGTPAYLAPEQVGRRGDAIGPAADLYAAALVLVEALCGRLPFEATDAMALVSERLRRSIGVERLCALGLEATDARLLAPCLARHPDERPHSPRSLLRALGGAGEGEVQQTRALAAVAPPSRPEGGGVGAATAVHGIGVEKEGWASTWGRLLGLGLVGLALLGLVCLRISPRPSGTETSKSVPEEGPKGARRWAALAARSPFLSREDLDGLVRAVKALDGADSRKRGETLRSWERELAMGSDSRGPACVLLRNWRLKGEGEVSPPRRFRPMARALDHLLLALAKRGPGKTGDSDWAAPRTLAEALLDIVEEHGSDGSLRMPVEHCLDGWFEGVASLPPPARDHGGDGRLRPSEQRACEAAMARLFVRSWHVELWPGLTDRCLAAVEGMLASPLPDGGISTPAEPEVPYLPWSKSSIRAVHTLRVDWNLKRAKGEEKLRVEQMAVVMLSWWRLHVLARSGLCVGTLPQLLRAQIRSATEFAGLLHHGEGRIPGLDARLLRSLSRHRFIWQNQRAVHELLRRCFDGAPRSPRDLAELRRWFQCSLSVTDHLDLAWDGLGKKFREAWGPLDELLQPWAGQAEVKTMLVRALYYDGRVQEAIAMAEEAFAVFRRRIDEGGRAAADLAEQAFFLRLVAMFLLRPTIATECPDATKRRVRWIRQFLAEWRVGPRFAGYEEIDESLGRRCNEAEGALAGEIVPTW